MFWLGVATYNALSSNRCAISPEYIAIVKESAGSAVAAPTGAGFGTSTLSVTTHTGVSATVRAVARITVAGAVATTGYVTWHYWDQAQNERAQNRAKERYYTVYPYDENCYTNTPEVLQEIHDIASSHENYRCVECASEIEAYLENQGIHGRRIKLDTTRLNERDDYIYDDSLPPKSEGGVISDNGHHEGIAIRINGEEIVFDNHHPDGVPYEQWKNNLTFFGKEHRGESFRESGYLF